jgi:hypothetical protein
MLHKTLPQHSLKQLHPLKRSKTSTSGGSIGTSSSTSIDNKADSIDGTTLDHEPSVASHEEGSEGGHSNDQETEKDDSEPEVDKKVALGMFPLLYVV